MATKKNKPTAEELAQQKLEIQTEVDGLLDQIRKDEMIVTELDAECIQKKTTVDEEFAFKKKKYDERLSENRVKVEQLCIDSRDVLFGEKEKTVKLTHGEVSFKLSPPKVSALDTAIDKVRKAFNRAKDAAKKAMFDSFINEKVTVSIDGKSVKKSIEDGLITEKELQDKYGITVTQEERFGYKVYG